VKYRKKPVVIEAVQFFAADHPSTWHPAIQQGGKGYDQYGEQFSYPRFWIKTLEGFHEVTDQDWIITGVKGEVYPCKPDIFLATYEPIKEST
jgi:hypothetical protein